MVIDLAHSRWSAPTLRSVRRAILITALGWTLALVAASPALATRYATPTGSATDPACALAAPCTLQRALIVSTPGEEVILAQGDYHVAAPAPDACNDPYTAATAGDIGIVISNRDVHGLPNRPRPRIIGSPTTCVTLSVANSGRVRHVELDNSDTAKPETYALVVDGGGFAYDVLTGGASPRAQMRNGAHMYNSVLNAGADGIALRSYFGSAPHNMPDSSSYITNVTARGKVLAASVFNSAVDIDCTNSIATGGFRLENHNSSHLAAEFASARLDHCIGSTSSDAGFNEAFDTTPGGNNPTGALALAPDGFHELLGSSSINNGLFTGALLGTTDIDGGARTFGPAVDIGADEFGSGLPTLDSGAVRSLAYHGATVAGSVNPGGLPTAVSVDYGPSTAYGQRATAVSLPGDFATHMLAFTLPGMTVNARYHYRLVASNGATAGEDRTITFPDADHDGYFANADCNEANPGINPGAKEIVGNTVDENCDGIVAKFPTLATDVSISFLFFKHYTKLTSLVLTKAVKGSEVKLTCHGGGCPFKTKTTAVKKSKRKLSVTKLVVKGRFARGAKLVLRITHPGDIGKLITLSFRNGHAPKKKTQCLAPGKTKPTHC